MNARSIAFGVFLMFSLPIHATVATDTILGAYPQTTLLVLEADLRLNLCYLKEFSLYLQVHPSEDSAGMDSPTQLWAMNNMPANEQEHTVNDILMCRKEAEESIKSRLYEAEQELSHKPIAQEKLKGFIAVWFSAIKVIPRTTMSKDALLAQQDDDRRAVRQRQSELEVELFWSYDQPGGWVSHRPPKS